MGPRLLLVEDDDGIAAPLVRALGREGYAIDRVASGGEALDRITTDRATDRPDLVILDLGLPDIDGLEVCQRAREAGYPGPILILTARGDELDRVVGLDTGADDYMAKPFGLAELLARVRSHLRRSVSTSTAPPAPSTEGAPSVAGVRVDDAARRAWVGDAELELTAKEFGLLSLLAAEAGSVITRERFMDEVWDEHWFGSTKTLDVTLGRLRQKLSVAGAPVRIVAVRGVGFRLEPADA